MKEDDFAAEFKAELPDEDGLPFGFVALADNPTMAERFAGRVAQARGLLSPEALETALKLADERVPAFRTNDPRMLAEAPPLYNERDRRAYAVFLSHYTARKHGEAKKLQTEIEARRRSLIQTYGLDAGRYLSYCFSAIPELEAFFFRAAA
jgi:hypothetical protein